MKKRSLIASIAMLLVSAIVLSTSTYAWFSAGASVSVDSITAEITQTDGSIEISANNSTWGSSIGLDDLKAVAGNALAYTGDPVNGGATQVTNLATVSGIPTTNGMASFVPASLTSASGVNTITSTAATTLAAGKYVFYKFYVRAADAATKVTVTPHFSVTGDKNFVIGAVSVAGSAPKFYGNADNLTYNPLKASQAVVDSNNDCIITTADSGVTVDDQILTAVTTSGGTFTDVTPGTDGIAVSVWIWAEGQEASCTGAVSGLSGSFSFDIATA